MKIKYVDTTGKEVLKTSEEWQKTSDALVYDPDGWDRKNFQYSWYEELITKQEFENRLIRSTIMYQEIKK